RLQVTKLSVADRTGRRHELKSLFDGGATISMIGSGVVRRMGFQPIKLQTKQEIHSFTGQQVATDLIILMNVKLANGMVMNHVFFVADELPHFDVILGMDFLGRHDSYGIDFKDGIVWLKKGKRMDPVVELEPDPLLRSVKQKIWDLESKEEKYPSWDMEI